MAKRGELEVNRIVAERLSQYADLLEISGENPYKVRAYRMAAHSIMALDLPVTQLTDEELLDLDGIGKSILRKIRAIQAQGTFPEFEELVGRYPLELIELRGVPGLTPSLIRKLYESMGITRLEELEGAAKRGELLVVEGIGPKTVAKILRGFEQRRLRMEYRPLWLAWDLAWDLQELLSASGLVRQFSVAGSTRRMAYRVRDLDVVVAMRDLSEVDELISEVEELKVFSQLEEIRELSPERRLIAFSTVKGMKVEMLVVSERLFPVSLLLMTGSQAHIERLREIAEGEGYVLSEEGVLKGGELVQVSSEEEIYELLGMQPIPPELREDRGEVEVALESGLPRLIELSDVRGDLHMHTYYSDGANSVYEMAMRAKSLGYEYIAIADHSQSLKIGGGLSPESLREQWHEIDVISERVGIKVLKGSEVDILPDGTLDYSLEVLSRLEWVIGSVHSKFNMPEREMTKRVVRALRNPYLHALGHPTGRLICIREPYSISLHQVIDEAAKLSKVMELNANPNRLDLWDEPLMYAKSKGVKVVINTDAHSTEQLQNMFYGVGQARRAWLTPEDVINTYPLERLLSFLREIRERTSVEVGGDKEG